jgi:anti-sigma regulatory factor (Ser/Thr protein kinase)
MSREVGESVERASLVAEPKAVGEARKLLGDVLSDRGIDRQRVQDVLLVTSELVANAVHHGSCRGDRVELEFQISHHTLTLCVRDAARAGATTPQVQALGGERSAGRGLAIVSRLARWSERVIDGRREVRAEMDL